MSTASGSSQPPAAPVTPPPQKDEDGPLTPEQVQSQLAQAAALAAQLRATDAGLQAAQDQLQAIGTKMSAALDALGQARLDQADAERVQATSTELLTRMQSSLKLQQDALGQWARETYAVGGPMSAYEGWLIALQGRGTGDVAHDLTILEEVGVAGGRAVQRLQDSVALQAQVQQQAGAAAARAAAATQRADQAVTTLEGLQAQARLASAQLRVQQAKLTGTAKLTAQQRANLVAAEAIVKAAGDVPPGHCKGLPTKGYADGLIPAAALCPLWGAPGQLLRADAAAAEGRLSHAYAAQFGTPLCVSDSYRTLAEQVKVYAEKPTLAAKPGTSNHGWGTALDLCGGVESFGTAQHAWMMAHAPLFGWFHPGWAEPTGSKPEPWHWEYAG